MGTYIVTATSHVAVELNDKDQIVGKTRYKRGDEIELDDAEAQRLVESGGLVPKGEFDEPSPEQREMLTAHAATLGAPSVGEVTELDLQVAKTGGITGGAGEEFDLGDPDFGEKVAEDDATADPVDSTEDLDPALHEPVNGTEDATSGPDYDSMNYRELQAAAKDVDGVAGNLPEDELRAALKNA
jgi:hypothetical protein